MFKDSKDLENLIYKCLIKVRNYSPKSEEHDLYFKDENHDLYDINYAWKEAANLNYVTGIHPVESKITGEFQIDRTTPKLTLSGLKFIENFEP